MIGVCILIAPENAYLIAAVITEGDDGDIVQFPYPDRVDERIAALNSLYADKG